MLRLSRKVGEGVYIVTPAGEHIVLRVFEARGSNVRLGIHCDEDVAVMREEIKEDMRAKGLDVSTAKALLANLRRPKEEV